jgi:cytochrome c peroxidase
MLARLVPKWGANFVYQSVTEGAMGARIAVVMGGAILLFAGVGVAADLMPNEELGKSIFFDEYLSSNANQACASCHDPAAGWTGPLSDINAHGGVYEGSIEGRFGNRKPPSAAYATPSPILHFETDHKEALFIGGNFWDGRATGEKLGNPAADQAQGPFLNPLEQALQSPAEVVNRICASAYNDLFTQVRLETTDTSGLEGMLESVLRFG